MISFYNFYYSEKFSKKKNNFLDDLINVFIVIIGHSKIDF